MLSVAKLTPPPDLADLDRWLTDIEDAVAADVRARLRAIVRDAYEAWTGSLRASIVSDWSALDSIPNDWTAYVVSDLAPAVTDVHAAGSLVAFLHTKDVVPPSFEAGWVDITTGAAVDYQRAATNRLVGVGDGVWSAVREHTVHAVANGASVEDLKGRVEEVTGFSEYRADTIARTETVGAYNAGNYIGQAALGDYGPTEKQWLAAEDARTRPSHAEADGQVVPFSGTFVVGGARMVRPHDPTAPAGEVVNCRCTTLFLYPGDKRPDGSTVEERPAPQPVEVAAPSYRQQLSTLQDEYRKMAPKGLKGWVTPKGAPTKAAREAEAKVREIGSVIDARIRRRIGEPPVSTPGRPALIQDERAYGRRYYRHLQSELADIRPMGSPRPHYQPWSSDLPARFRASPGIGNSALGDKAMEHYPTDWNDAAGFADGKVWIGDIEPGNNRGFHYSTTVAPGDSRGVIHIPMSRNDDAGLIAHEAGHRMEATVPGLREQEWVFQKRRAGTEKPRPLSELTGVQAYAPSEVGVGDDYDNPYMGKRYGDLPTANSEAFAMGIEGVVGGRYQMYSRDADYRHWIVGLLSTL